MIPAPPASRRLRIFATDPGASIELNTAFINEATVEVPWETARSAENLLTPGPVGEYVEVVDVDPASARVYDPVDLNNPYLLAQDGASPLFIALQSTDREPTRSRIVVKLADGIVTTPRAEADLVVTEHGVAELRGRTLAERARALVAVADPAFRAELEQASDRLV
jgi:hypothetical protein